MRQGCIPRRVMDTEKENWKCPSASSANALNKTGQVWIDTDKPRVDTLSTQTKAIPRDKWQAALMPYLTAAHARKKKKKKRARGGSDDHVHARPYGRKGLADWMQLQRAVFSLMPNSQNAEDCAGMKNPSAECSLERQIDISDSASISGG